ncbi:MAG: PSD1 domain-containing protein [Planctomycetaceae bacterium]|nr:PSD1 domain-containing protein [Planctomycetaceae bacterium]
MTAAHPRSGRPWSIFGTAASIGGLCSAIGAAAVLFSGTGQPAPVTAAEPAAAKAESPKTEAARAAADGEPVDFNRDIRPILSNSCYACHGPDAGQRQAGLRLDTSDGAVAELESGNTAVVAGDVAASELISRITSDAPEQRMPPPGHEHPLTKQEIDLLTRWVQQGAPWSDHWAFIAPRRPELPEVDGEASLLNPIDRFIVRKARAAGLQQSPEASKETLIRRVTFDLTGLPPTPAEIDAFLEDTAPGAYGRLVDRLLGTEAYGEQMARHWLDAARYGDTHGLHLDNERSMWLYRDWVIDAFSQNMPFDQFTIEQIAGDLLPEPTESQLIATGFHRNHMLNGEGGRIAEESRVEYVVDRVSTTSTVWLGLTIGCSRCHDHKYDPVSQREFYSLYAFFNQVAETGSVDRRSGTAAPVLELPTAAQSSEIARLTEQIAGLKQQQQQLEQKILSQQAEWERQVRMARAAGGVPKDQKPAPTEDTQKPSASAAGTDEPEAAEPQAAESKTVPSPAESADAQPLLSSVENVPAGVRGAVEVPADSRTKEQQSLIRTHLLVTAPGLAELHEKISQAEKSLNSTKKSVLLTMVMQDRTEPRETFLLKRGQYDQYGEQVEAGVPACLPPLPDKAPVNRLGLARWLTSPDNPLTARVTVNRIWQQFFGQGLVRTPEDFGTQGERPTHPELLDWLAVEFMDPASGGSHRWDVKALTRLIVTSATYRQSSRLTPELADQDPENRLLGRAWRGRLSSFQLRDQALSLAGLLVPQQYGAPVHPYQPPGVWSDLTLGKIVYKQDTGADLYRRSLYTFWRRSVGPTSLFDTSSRQVCVVSQGRTNTPLHALTLLNDTTWVEAARKLAERMLLEGGDDDRSRLRWGFRLASARLPDEAELAVLTRTLNRGRNAVQQDPAEAVKLLAVGESPVNGQLPPGEIAAWSAVATVLLNLDEVLSRE